MTKTMMALALASASVLTCGQAQAVTVVEIWGGGVWTRTDYRLPITESSTFTNMQGTFYAKFALAPASIPGPPVSANVGPVTILYGPGSLAIDSYAPSSISAYTINLDIDFSGAKPTGSIRYTEGSAYSGFGTLLTGPVGSATVRIFDDANYTSAIVLAAVPEPATWAMMIAGFGLVGSALRQRKAVMLAHAS